MGFGILFIGYFFLISIGYFTYTDALAAAILLLALHKLSWVNKYFKHALTCDFIFCAVGAAELFLEIYTSMAYVANASLLNSIFASARSAVICTLTVLMLTGILEVAGEVGLDDISKRARKLAVASFGIYLTNLLLESAAIFGIKSIKLLAVLTALTLIATLVLTAFILALIYKCYMRIAMPDEREYEEKESRFAIVRAFKKHEEEKQREYAEYKLEKFKNKQSKRKQKENKK